MVEKILTTDDTDGHRSWMIRVRIQSALPILSTRWYRCSLKWIWLSSLFTWSLELRSQHAWGNFEVCPRIMVAEFLTTSERPVSAQWNEDESDTSLQRSPITRMGTSGLGYWFSTRSFIFWTDLPSRLLNPLHHDYSLDLCISVSSVVRIWLWESISSTCVAFLTTDGAKRRWRSITQICFWLRCRPWLGTQMRRLWVLDWLI